MGADLYIKKQDRKRQYTGFKTDIGVGYFRDPYNKYNLLWQFGLSYWTDIVKTYSNKNGEMTPVKAKKLLDGLKARESTFKENLKDLLKFKNPVWDYEKNLMDGTKLHSPDKDLSKKEREGLVKYYNKQYKRLKMFLNKAVRLKSNILCSC